MSRFHLAPAACAAAMIAALAISVAAQAPVDLGKRNARSKYTLGRVAALRELPDGRVVVADAKEGAFRVVDFAKGDVGLVGRQGDDADNYRSASGVFPLGGDSLLLYDGVGRKFLHLTPAGGVAAVVPFPATPTRLVRPTVMDGSGAFYYPAVEFDSVTKTAKSSLHRWRPGAATEEVLTALTTRRADQMKLNGMVPFVFRDFWGAREDGLVARVVSDTYQVIWLRDGKETGRTGPLPYPTIAIAPAEQQAIRDSLAQMFAPGGAAMSAGRGGGTGFGGPISLTDLATGTRTVFINGGGGAPIAVGSASGGPPAATGAAPSLATAVDSQRIKDAMVQMAKNADIPAENFPAAKPALPSIGTNILLFDGGGLLWVPREHVRGDLVPHYDVIAEGKGIVAHVNLPPGTRLIGFGKNAVYLARTEDGSDWLERYTMPKM